MRRRIVPRNDPDIMATRSDEVEVHKIEQQWDGHHRRLERREIERRHSANIEDQRRRGVGQRLKHPALQKPRDRVRCIE